MDLSLLVKAHSGVAGVTLLIYIIRGMMMLANSSKTNARGILAIASIFTLLLFGSGIYLGFSLKLSFADGYMLTKIISLLLFVAFGVVALKQGLSKVVASILWLLGLAAFIYAYLIASKILLPLF
jgi:uncharacterized membrane protein SirB2